VVKKKVIYGAWYGGAGRKCDLLFETASLAKAGEGELHLFHQLKYLHFGHSVTK